MIDHIYQKPFLDLRINRNRNANCRFTVSSSDSGIEVDEDSYDNTIYDNLMIDIPNQDDALFIENGAASQNTFYSNILLDSDGNRIDLGENNMPEASSNVNNSSNND